MEEMYLNCITMNYVQSLLLYCRMLILVTITRLMDPNAKLNYESSNRYTKKGFASRADFVDYLVPDSLTQYNYELGRISNYAGSSGP
ncbi:Cytochrome P450 monooxygenase alt3 [Fusarium oxysporum f. sp. albedinis]|nr:Cytochrome P450 monooxygenase alt3 [Fusarium oxysporum f. sp. albedinis]